MTAGMPHATDMAPLMLRFVMQLAVIIIAARLGGSLFQRFLRLPRVLGELSAGMVIGPYALGHLPLPGYGPLFEAPSGAIPVTPELYAVATLASVVLLFLTGLETDMATFLRYSFAGTMVGIGGVLFSFGLGVSCALWFGVAERALDPAALFLGTIATATSVGITARLLTEKRQSHSPEGVTIMAAAVLDDVLGIILLAVVVGLSRFQHTGDGVRWSEIGWIAAKAFGFWLVCTVAGLLSARRLSRLLKWSRTPATVASLALGLALLLAGLSEMAGLAMIIGAYIAGLALSRTDLVDFLQEQLHGVYELFVPVFFCVMGMLVDVGAMGGVLGFGLAYSALAFAAKVGGCGLPALLTGFNLRGAWRIGLGMLPRGEVALIIAGVGLSTGIIGNALFSVSIMMTMITTLAAPPLLIKALEGGSGIRGRDQRVEPAHPLTLTFPSPDIAEFLLMRIVRAFRQEEFFVHRVRTEQVTYQIRKEELSFSLLQQGPEITLIASPSQQHVARLVLLEEILSLEDLLETSRKMEGLSALETRLVRDLFPDQEKK